MASRALGGGPMGTRSRRGRAVSGRQGSFGAATFAASVAAIAFIFGSPSEAAPSALRSRQLGSISPATLAPPTITSPKAGDVIGVAGVTFGWTEVVGADGYSIEVTSDTTGALVFSGSVQGAASTTTLISLTDDSYRFSLK